MQVVHCEFNSESNRDSERVVDRSVTRLSKASVVKGPTFTLVAAVGLGKNPDTQTSDHEWCSSISK